MIHSITAELTYIQFRSTDIETAEKFFQHKLKKIDDKTFEFIDGTNNCFLRDGYAYAKLNGSDIPITFENFEALSEYFDIYNKEKTNTESLNHANRSETAPQNPEKDKASNVPDIGAPLLSGKMYESINIESELERILTIQKNRTINLDTEKAKFENELDSAVLFNFNVGLLCGLKLARGAK